MTSDTGRVPATGDPHDKPVAELVRDLTELLPRLVREEITLAQRELAHKGKRAGVGAGMFGGGGLIALYGVAALLTAAGLGLANAMPGWLAALVVAAVLLAVAGILALLARRQVSQATPPVPEQAMQGVREDIATVKERARR